MDTVTTPVVSVIIPTYQRPESVMRSIRSALDQTYRDIEVIVMDDSRNEETKKAAAEINDGRFRYIYNVDRFGYVENKNQGVRLANPVSRYIAFLDDDDIYLPHFLERTVAELEKNPKAIAAVTDCELRRVDGAFIKRYHCERNIFWKVSLGNGAVVRKDVFTKLGIWFDKNVAFEDLDFGLRIVKDHPWISIPEVLRVYYRYYTKMGDSVSTMFVKTTPREELESLLKKDEAIYAAAGDLALAWVHALTGKMLVRAGHYAAGREHLRAALKYDFRLSYVVYYLVALIFPAAFLKSSVAVFKNKVTGFFKK
jgi:glycosyltransferase involved in cell wall biosynthesis